MPNYIYENPKTGEQVEVFQSIHDDHVYQVDGHFWKRVWTKPLMSVNSKLDPRSKESFLNYTSNKRGTLGDIMDLSKECSEARKSKEGVDNVKEKFYENYSKQRKGRLHPDKAKEQVKKKLSKNFEIEF